MIGLEPYIVLGVLVLGVVLTWGGLRGRRVNDHPVCRRCRFDLHGVYPGGVTCPECGSGLKGPRAIRVGVRVRRRWALRIGVTVLILSGLLGGAMVWVLAAGPNANKYKPAMLLVFQGRFAGVKRSQEAANEVIRRLQGDEMTDSSIAWAVDAALSIQGDSARPWVPEWGTVIELANAAGKVSNADYARFLHQSVLLGMQARPSVIAGERLPLIVGVEEWRRASANGLYVGVWIDRVKIGGREVEWVLYGEKRLALRNSMGPLRIASTAKGTWGATPQVWTDTLGLELDLPEGLAPGTWDVEIEVRVSAAAGAAITWDEAQAAANARMTLRRSVRIEAQGSRSTPAAGSEEQLRGLLSGVRVSATGARRASLDEEPAWHAYVDVPRTGAPMPFAYDVSIAIGEKEFPAGWVVSGRIPRRERLGVARGGGVTDPETSVLLVAEIAGSDEPFRDVRRCRVIFHPRPDLLPLTLDMTECCDREIVIDDVTFEWEKPMIQK